MADASKNARKRSDSRAGFRFLGVGLEITAAVVGFSLVGWWIGGKLGGERSGLWGLLIGFALGFAGGMYNLLKETRAGDEEPDDESGSGGRAGDGHEP